MDMDAFLSYFPVRGRQVGLFPTCLNVCQYVFCVKIYLDCNHITHKSWLSQVTMDVLFLSLLLKHPCVIFIRQDIYDV